MSVKDLIPGFGSAPVPLPVPIVVFLLVFTFIIHIFFVLAVMGTTLAGAVERLRGRAAEARVLTSPNIVNISLLITTGIAPLLFVQVLYGPLFYTATILLAWLWFSLIWTVIAAYYLFYYYRERGSSRALWLATLGFLFVLGLQVAVAVKWQFPQTWLKGLLSYGPVWPRLLHALAGSAVLGGAFGIMVAQYKLSRGKEDPEVLARAASVGRWWALGGLIAQILVGLWYLFSLGEATGLFLGGHPVGTGMLALAAVLVLVALVSLALAKDPLRSKLSWVGFGALALNLVPMSVMRHVLRDWSLGRVDYHPGALPVKPQWGPFIIFALGLVLALLLVLWGAWRAHVETRERAALKQT